MKFIDGLNLKVEIGTPKRAKKNSNEAVGVVKEDILGEVSDFLDILLKQNNLPSNETWSLKEASNY